MAEIAPSLVEAAARAIDELWARGSVAAPISAKQTAEAVLVAVGDALRLEGAQAERARKADGPYATGFEIASLQRGRVATWLRLKATGGNNADLGLYRDICGSEVAMQRLFQQLQNDALHSGLLWRLFNGEEPQQRGES